MRRLSVIVAPSRVLCYSVAGWDPGAVRSAVGSEKSRKEIKVRKMTSEKKGGPGVRLGIAYQLPDGSVVYVPEESGAK